MTEAMTDEPIEPVAWLRPNWQEFTDGTSPVTTYRIAGWLPLYTSPPTTADQLAEAQREIERLRGTLQFYARENSWRSCGMYMSGRENPSSAEFDRGKRARAALEPKP